VKVLDRTSLAVGLLTGGQDRPYAIGLATALLSDGVSVDFIGSDQLESQELQSNPQCRFLNLRGNQRQDASAARKVVRVLKYYVRLVSYAWAEAPKVLHILWNNKFEIVDRTVLMLYYKCIGKKIVLTAHNVNAGRRDSNDSTVNRLTLWAQYRLADHIFVHTELMEKELRESFGVSDRKVSVVPLGINNSVPQTDLSPEGAKQRLGLGSEDRTILFFGSIKRYKGLEFLVEAFQIIAAKHPKYRLIVAGSVGRGYEEYFDAIERRIREDIGTKRIILRIEHIPDDETEIYFKAADVLVLPYTAIAQSGVLVLGYSFGLPVIATDVGSFAEDIVEGWSGYVCRPRDAANLAETIERYFESDVFGGLRMRREVLREYADRRYSWQSVSEVTRSIYERMGRD
jgi:glycosyltransferase involved in cell wall biosynthesis